MISSAPSLKKLHVWSVVFWESSFQESGDSDTSGGNKFHRKALRLVPVTISGFPRRVGLLTGVSSRKGGVVVAHLRLRA